MKWMDYLGVGFFALCLFGLGMVADRPMTMHECVLPQCAREMQASNEWLVPTSGGRAWLHRPPLPHWVLMVLSAPFHALDNPSMVRLGPTVMGTITVLLLCWMAQLWHGRTIGILTGLVLATCVQFTRYAWLAEEDMFLCAVVTAAIACLIKLEFTTTKDNYTTWNWKSFLGGRSLWLLGFFTLIGLSNLAKGLIFGPLMILVPCGLYLLWNFSLQRIGRYIWLWGMLVAVAIAAAWPLWTYWNFPDVLEMWLFDYKGRLNEGYVSEPWWYYVGVLPWAIAPWTPLALIGLVLAVRKAVKEKDQPSRLLLCWGVGTLAFFSIPDGKHHHYLLHFLPPWAILSVQGLVWLRERIANWSAIFKQPALASLCIGVPLAVAAFLLKSMIPGPAWVLYVSVVSLLLLPAIINWALQQKSLQTSMATLFTLLFVGNVAGYLYAKHYADHGREDWAFLRTVPSISKEQQLPLYVNAQLRSCLEVNRVLFCLDKETKVVHNLTYLLDEKLTNKTIAIVTVAADQKALEHLGTVKVLSQSSKSRREETPADRLTLFELTFKAGLERYPASAIKIEQQQIKHRKPGPFLGGKSPMEWLPEEKAGMTTGSGDPRRATTSPF